jgi:hypothetical protein
MCSARAERADVKAWGAEGRGERGVVDLRVVGERNDSRILIDANRRQDRIGPLGPHRCIRKALRRRKGDPWVDDCDVEIQHLGHGSQCLADMNGADADDPHRRSLNGQKELAAITLDKATLALAQAYLQLLSQRVTLNFRLPNEALIARCDVGDEDGGTPCGTLRVEIR